MANDEMKINYLKKILVLSFRKEPLVDLIKIYEESGSNKFQRGPHLKVFFL